MCSGNVSFAFSSDFIRIYYPLVLKTYVRIQPPIQWKGGMLQELFKGKGSSSVCSNFRDVMLACVDGKNVAKYIRNKLLPRPTIFPSIHSLVVVLMVVKPPLPTCMSG